MIQSKLFKPFIVTLFVVGIFNTLAIIFHLFWSVMWFDMIMHFSGGFFISIGAIWILSVVNSQKKLSYGKLLFYGVSSAIIVGFLWECFELYFDLTNMHSFDYIGDNGMDMTMDTFGGLVAVWYSHFKLNVTNSLIKK